jgi:hypothetical protein
LGTAPLCAAKKAPDPLRLELVELLRAAWYNRVVGVGRVGRAIASGRRGLFVFPEDVMRYCSALACTLALAASPLSGDETKTGSPKLPPEVAWHGRDYLAPQHYVCCRVAGKLKIDGRLDDEAWRAAAWTDDFVDIEGDARPKPRFRTRAKMLWDDDFFYVAAELEEPHVWGTLTEHDAIIYHDNDFEVFVDPNGDNHNYAEFEINTLGTGFDLRLPKPYKDGGDADIPWAIPGLKSGIHIEGTLNDPADEDHLWTVELAFPWKELGKLDDSPAPPKDGDQWRVNFSRVEWRHKVERGNYVKIPKEESPEDNWVWSPQHAINMHRPETWGYVQFSTEAPDKVEFRLDPTGPARHLLHQVYYAQKAHHAAHECYATELKQLGLNELSHKSLARPIVLSVDGDAFSASAVVKLPGGKTRRLRIRQDALIEMP